MSSWVADLSAGKCGYMANWIADLSAGKCGYMASWVADLSAGKCGYMASWLAGRIDIHIIQCTIVHIQLMVLIA